jgi:hypothetical protein
MKLVMNIVVVNAVTAGVIPAVFLDADAAVGRFEVEFVPLNVPGGVAVVGSVVNTEDSVPTPSKEPVGSLAAVAKLVLTASDVMV